MLRKIAIFLFGLGIFAALNFAIYEKERILSHGETMLVELAPVDPRSLMQGDYMQLNYAVSRDPRFTPQPPKGKVVLQKNADGVAELLRFDDGTPIAAGQMLLLYNKGIPRQMLQPSSFLFQEGHAELYENAKYGIYSYDANGNALLTGLADDAKKPITPKE